MRESISELVDPLGKKLLELRNDWQTSESALIKLQSQFHEFSDEFISTNNSNPQALVRRQALIDLVFRKLQEAED